MSHNVTSNDIPTQGEKVEAKHLALPKLIALIVFVVGAIGSALLFTNDTWGGGFAYSWVFAFMFFISLALGGCFWTILHHVTNSGWGVSVRRLMENLGFVFPFFAVIAIPLMIPSVQNNLYEWMDIHRETNERYVEYQEEKGKEATPSAYAGAGDALAHEADIAFSEGKKSPDHFAHLLSVKYWYMNLPFWLIRVVCFFLLLGAGIFILRKISIDQDNDPKPGIARLIKARKYSCIIMPIFAVVATFIALDFMMALDYKWFSTMYGVYFFAGCALNSMAVLILTLTWLRSKGYLQIVTSQEHYHIMGKLMHAFVIFWAYVSFAQFMLIWYANITEETSYFLLRNTDEWWVWSLSLTFIHFAIPFVLLLPHYAKKRIKIIVPICIYLLSVHFIDLYIAVVPERGPSLSEMAMNQPEVKTMIDAGVSGAEIQAKFPQVGLNSSGEVDVTLFVNHNAYLGDIVAFITVGAFFLFLFLRHIGSANTYPNRDPRILESANLHN